MAIHRLNFTFVDGNTTKDCTTHVQLEEENSYDSQGAMHFIIAVVVVYGVAVLGVFVLSHFRRKRKLQNQELDKQATYFIKHMPSVRENIEKQQRLCSIYNLLPDNSRYSAEKRRMTVLGESIIKYIAIPLLVNGETVKDGTGNTLLQPDTDVELGHIECSDTSSSGSSASMAALKTVNEVTTDGQGENDEFVNCSTNTLGVNIV